jgi:hypothetical protein
LADHERGQGKVMLVVLFECQHRSLVSLGSGFPVRSSCWRCASTCALPGRIMLDMQVIEALYLKDEEPHDYLHAPGLGTACLGGCRGGIVNLVRPSATGMIGGLIQVGEELG